MDSKDESSKKTCKCTKMNKNNFIGVFVNILAIICIIVLFLISLGSSLPSGDISFSSNTTSAFDGYNASNDSAQGGTITTIIFNASQQTMKWKAYIGNISGSLSLRNSDNFTLYDWSLNENLGEIYASRANNVNWSSMNCTNQTLIDNEEALLSFDPSSIDSINNTFNNSVHKGFYVSGTNITNSTCRAIMTNINNSDQGLSESGLFQEVLLSDKTNLVYASILETDLLGYNNQTFDFQMILADTESTSTITTYYFYIELG